MNMDESQKSKKYRALLPYFLFALAVIVAHRIVSELGFVVNAIGRALDIISPFFYGFLAAYILNIPCSSIQRLFAKVKINFIRKRQRVLSILSVFILLFFLIALGLNLVIPTIVNSISFFIENVPSYWERIVHVVAYINNMEFFGRRLNINISSDAIFNMIGNFFGYIGFENLSRPLSVIMDAGATVFSGFIAFIASIYILFEKDKFKEFLRRLFRAIASHAVYTVVLDHASRLNNNFRQYIRTQTIDGIILGTLMIIVLLIMGSPYALVLGIMLGIVNYIPYFGSIFGTLVAVIVVAFTQGLTMGLISAAILFTIQQIDGNVIQPKLMSGSFSLSPLLVIISITIGGAIAGIFGMLVAIPIVAVLKDILDSVIAHWERKKLEQSAGEDGQSGQG